MLFILMMGCAVTPEKFCEKRWKMEQECNPEEEWTEEIIEEGVEACVQMISYSENDDFCELVSKPEECADIKARFMGCWYEVMNDKRWCDDDFDEKSNFCCLLAVDPEFDFSNFPTATDENVAWCGEEIPRTLNKYTE